MNNSYPLPDRDAPRFSEAMETLKALWRDGELNKLHLLNPLRVQRPSPMGLIEDEVKVLNKGQRVTIVNLGTSDGLPYMQLENALTTDWFPTEWRELGDLLCVDKCGMSLGRLLEGEFGVRYGGHWTQRSTRRPAKLKVPPPTYKEEALEPAEEILAWLERHQQEGEF